MVLKALTLEEITIFYMPSSHIPFNCIPKPNTCLADLRPQNLVEEY